MPKSRLERQKSLRYVANRASLPCHFYIIISASTNSHQNPQPVVFEHLGAPCDGKCVELQCGVLIEGADPGVSNMCHGDLSVIVSDNHVVRLPVGRPGFPDISKVTVQRSFGGPAP